MTICIVLTAERDYAGGHMSNTSDYRLVEHNGCCPLNEIGTGWHPLVIEMCEKLAPHINENFRITQIKEKFGALRVTAEGASSEACEIIEDYEQRSTHICEFCGAPGKLRPFYGWWKTMCGKCEENIWKMIEPKPEEPKADT